jgi:hypothetical protein
LRLRKAIGIRGTSAGDANLILVTGAALIDCFRDPRCGAEPRVLQLRSNSVVMPQSHRAIAE